MDRCTVLSVRRSRVSTRGHGASMVGLGPWHRRDELHVAHKHVAGGPGPDLTYPCGLTVAVTMAGWDGANADRAGSRDGEANCCRAIGCAIPCLASSCAAS